VGWWKLVKWLSVRMGSSWRVRARKIFWYVLSFFKLKSESRVDAAVDTARGCPLFVPVWGRGRGRQVISRH